MTAETPDVATVGISPRADERLKALKETEWFDREVDVYRLAVSVALTADLTLGEIEARETKFNVGTLETPTGQVAGLIRLLAPEHAARPYAYSQELAEAGISFLYERIVKQNATIHEAIGTL